MCTLRNFTRTLIIVGLGTLATGCASWVTVKSTKEFPTAKGFRYSLTAPYLLVAPADDGSLTYQWLSLPDTSKQYAVETHSLLATHTTELTINHAILDKIVANSDSSAVAVEALNQAGAVFEAKRKGALKEKSDAKTAAKDADRKLKELLATAEAAERTTSVDLQKAQAKADLLRGQSPQDKGMVFEAETNLKIAQIDHDAALNEVNRIKGLKASANLGANSRNDGANTGTGETRPQAWGPVLFRVVQTSSGVTLQAIHTQTLYDAYGEKSAASGDGLALEITAAWNAPDKSLTLSTEAKFPELTPDRFRLNQGDKPFETKMAVKKGDDGKSVTVTFDPALPKGSYVLQLAFKDKTKASPAKFDVP